MSEDVYVDLSYLGLSLGNRLCMQDFTESEAYLQCPEPMPVGSTLIVGTGELEIEVLVGRVGEQVAGATRPPGMFVKPGTLDAAAQKWWTGQVPGESERKAPDTEVTPVVTPQEVEAAKKAQASETSAKPGKKVKVAKKRRRKKK